MCSLTLGSEETFGGDRYAYYLDCSDGLNGVYMFKQSNLYIINFYSFVYHLYFNESVIFLKSMYLIQCNPYQNTNESFQLTRANNPKIHMEPQKITNSQSNLEKKEQTMGISFLLLSYTTELQWLKHYDAGTRTADTKINGLEQRPRNKCMDIQSINI